MGDGITEESVTIISNSMFDGTPMRIFFPNVGTATRGSFWFSAFTIPSTIRSNNLFSQSNTAASMAPSIMIMVYPVSEKDSLPSRTIMKERYVSIWCMSPNAVFMYWVCPSVRRSMVFSIRDVDEDLAFSFVFSEMVSIGGNILDMRLTALP